MMSIVSIWFAFAVLGAFLFTVLALSASPRARRPGERSFDLRDWRVLTDALSGPDTDPIFSLVSAISARCPEATFIRLVDRVPGVVLIAVVVPWWRPKRAEVGRRAIQAVELVRPVNVNVRLWVVYR